MDPEIKAMNTVGEALSAIEDEEGRKRVLRWANDRFGYQPEQIRTPPTSTVSQPVTVSTDMREIAGIAMLAASGEFRVTVRDVKARSAVDAALRLTHIAIRAHERLTGQKSMSSKNTLVPLLKSWRVYDGNARYALAKHKGIVRNGDNLELDFHAQNDADRYVDEALNSEVEGTWSPTTKVKKKRSDGSQGDKT